MAFLSISPALPQLLLSAPVNTVAVAPVLAPGVQSQTVTSKGSNVSRSPADYRRQRAAAYTDDGVIRRGMLVDELV